MTSRSALMIGLLVLALAGCVQTAPTEPARGPAVATTSPATPTAMPTAPHTAAPTLPSPQIAAGATAAMVESLVTQQASPTPAPTAAVLPSPTRTVAPTVTPAIAARATAARATAAQTTVARATAAQTTVARATAARATAAQTTAARATAAQATAAPATVAPTLGSPTLGTPTPVAPTIYRVSEITLPTYPYAPHLKPAPENGPVVYPVQVLDRAAYEAVGARPSPQKHRLLLLENKYLRLSILPDLGGRIYECIFKPTGNNEFYSNTVIKPTEWGPPAPTGANWWIAAGGLEWGFPVDEHGYEFGTVWGFDHAAQPNGGMMITLFTRNGPQGPYAVVDIILPPDTAYFVVQPRIVNPLGQAFRFKWWANAMLAPGAPASAGPGLNFVLPAAEVTVHSTGDAALPAAGQAMSWPVYNGRDFSRLGEWREYLGVFQRPAASGGFMGVYDPTFDEGLLRVYPAQVAKGAKFFAPVRIDTANWTDDGSTYVEMHGGLEPTFDTWYELAPGAEVTWAEFWYPVAGIGGVTWANEGGALFVTPAVGGLRVALAPTSTVRGRLTIDIAGSPPWARAVDIAPDRPFAGDIPTVSGAGQLRVTLTNDAGVEVFQYAGPIR